MPLPPRPLSPFTWFRQHAERTPLRLLLLTLVLLLPCVLYAADRYADMWAVRALDETVAEARTRLALRQRTMNDEFELAFAGLRRLPDLLALDDRVRDEVAPRPEAAPHKPPQASVGRRTPLNAFLKTFAETMDLHIAWLIDHTGLTIATSNYDSADSLLGTNYADRAYFIAAMSGERGRQFAVGRVSSVPGFFFASPVRQYGTVLGVVAVKTDLPTLSRRLRLDAAFVTDEQGVVVLANDKAHIFHALPDAPVRDMPVSARLLRYKREAFPELSLRPFVVRGISETHGLTLIGEATRPALLGVIHRPQDGLSLHVAEDVGEALTLEDRRQVRFHLAVLSGLAVLGTLLSAIIYTLRNRAQLHIIEANNQALTRLNEELRCMAERDHLTGCFNRRRLDEAMNAGRDVILDIEIQGALQVCGKRPETVRIFISPPSWSELERRLTERGTDSPEKIQKRLLRAKVEFQTAHTYDYFVINDTVEDAVEELDAIMTAEHCKPAERMEIISGR